MDLGFLVDQINEKSGARAPMKIAQGLAQLGEKVTIYSYQEAKDGDVEDKLKKLGVKINYIQNPKSRLGKFVSGGSLLPPLRANNHDLISCHSSYPLFFAAKRSGKPIIYTYYGTQLTKFDRRMEKEIGLKTSWLRDQKLKLADQVILRLEKMRIHRSKRVVGISKSTVDEAKNLYGRAIDFIYLGADLEEKRVQLKAKKHGLLLLSVSRITPYKGFHKVISAFNNLKHQFPQARLVIIGTSANSQYLDFLKKQGGAEVEIILSPSDSILMKYYKDCDLYVSGTSWEGFGLPFLEAQLLGKPVVGFKNTSLPEVVDDKKTGFLAESQEEFESSIRKLCQDSILRQEMGRAGSKFAGNFTWEKTAKEYQTYFNKFMERGSK